MKLPKWPRLLVRGRNIRPEQADKVILRTTWYPGLSGNDRRWTKTINRVFGITAGTYGEEWDQWEVRARQLGALDLNYLHNDRIATSYADGPYGWVSWGGQVYSAGTPLTAKWPTVEEVTDEWRAIAHAFPFLTLTAQLVDDQWDDSYEHVVKRIPLVTWSVGRGAVEIHATPGEVLVGRPAEVHDRWGWPTREIRERRLRSAVRRTLKDAARNVPRETSTGELTWHDAQDR